MVLDGVLAEPEVVAQVGAGQGRDLHERALVRAARGAAPGDGGAADDPGGRSRPQHTHASDLAALGSELNRHLSETTDGARFATLFFGVYDDEARTLRYLNAGHVPPIVIRGGQAECIRRLDASGTVLGLFPSMKYEEQSVVLEPGDRLLIFTDGITEAEAPDGEMFGDERLLESVRRLAHLPAEELPVRLLAEVTAFVGPSQQQDDITVIAAEVV